MSAPWWDIARWRYQPVAPHSKLYRFWAIMVMMGLIVLATGCEAAKEMHEGHVSVGIDSTYDGAWHTRNANPACAVVVTDKTGRKHRKVGYVIIKGKSRAQTVSIYINHKYQRSVDSNHFCGGLVR